MGVIVAVSVFMFMIVVMVVIVAVAVAVTVPMIVIVAVTVAMCVTVTVSMVMMVMMPMVVVVMVVMMVDMLHRRQTVLTSIAIQFDFAVQRLFHPVFQHFLEQRMEAEVLRQRKFSLWIASAELFKLVGHPFDQHAENRKYGRTTTRRAPSLRQRSIPSSYSGKVTPMKAVSTHFAFQRSQNSRDIL